MSTDVCRPLVKVAQNKLKPHYAQPMQYSLPSPKPNPISTPFTHLNLTPVESAPVKDESAKGDHTVHVEIIIGSTGKTIKLDLKATDTVQKLKEMLSEEEESLGPEVAVAFRGKPLGDIDRLCDLNIRKCAQFVTYHRCHGG